MTRNNKESQNGKSTKKRKIESDYSVILSGTPLENKLDELYSIVEFVDNFRLAPYYLFKENHIFTDETGKVLGYKNLNEIGKEYCLHRHRRAGLPLRCAAMWCRWRARSRGRRGTTGLCTHRCCDG